MPSTQPFDASKLVLTLAWNREQYVVPMPALVPASMERSDAFRAWWKVGDIRTLEHIDDAGRRYVVETMGKVKDGDGRIKPFLRHISRYRPDGTLEVTTNDSPDGPDEWTIYGEDGKTPTVRVVNRLHGIEGTPFIQYVYFLAPDGRKERGYQANRHGVVYLEWFYRPDGSPDHWNGSSKLDGPIVVNR